MKQPQGAKPVRVRPEGLFFVVFVLPQLYPVPDQVSKDVAEAYAQCKGHRQDDAPEDYQEAHRNDRIAQSDVFEDDAEGDDDKEDPYGLGDEIAVFDPGVFTGEIDNSTQKVAEYDAYDQDHQRYDNVRQGSGDPGGVFRELGDPHVIKAEREEKDYKYPINDLAEYKGRRRADTAFFEKCDDPCILGPLIEPEENKGLAK